MSVCTFFAADHPLPPVSPSQDYPLVINIDEGTIFDGSADDNFFLHPFPEVSVYSDRAYGVRLEWEYTEGRARQLIRYIQEALCHSETVELWHIWLLGWWEWEDRPVIHSRSIPLSNLTPQDLRRLTDAPIWDTPDPQNPERPAFHRLIITK